MSRLMGFLAAIIVAVIPIIGQTTDAEADKFGVYINKRPLRDFSDRALEEIRLNNVDLLSKFKVVISGTLGEGSSKSTIVLKEPKSITAVGDADSVKGAATLKLVQDAILAIGDSGWLGHLYRIDVRTVVISIEQTDLEFSINVRSTQPNEKSARMTTSGLNAFLSIAIANSKGDEHLVLSKMKVLSESKDFILQFLMPKPEFHELLERQIASSAK